MAHEIQTPSTHHDCDASCDVPDHVHGPQRLRDAESTRLLRQTVLGVTHRRLARLADQPAVRQLVANQLLHSERQVHL